MVLLSYNPHVVKSQGLRLTYPSVDKSRLPDWEHSVPSCRLTPRLSKSGNRCNGILCLGNSKDRAHKERHLGLLQPHRRRSVTNRIGTQRWRLTCEDEDEALTEEETETERGSSAAPPHRHSLRLDRIDPPCSRSAPVRGSSRGLTGSRAGVVVAKSTTCAGI